jgi:hypothetical protein
MRVGKLDATLRAALKLNYAELKNQFDKTLAKAKQDGDEDARKGKPQTPIPQPPNSIPQPLPAPPTPNRSPYSMHAGLRV